MLDITHPDNINLAIEITKYLRLDLAGIDLIIPDIRKSWREQKSVVLEVNAMPQISGTRHKHLLPKLISGNGRIPSILFIGDLTQSSIHQKLIDLAEVKKMNLGIASNNEAWCNSDRKLSNSRDLNQSSLHLISDPTIDALTLHINIDSKLPFILPIDRIDAIIVMEKIVKNLNDPEKTKWLKNLCAYSNLLISLNQEAKVLVDICKKPTLKILNMSESKMINFSKELFN
jgi:cyanophycin synthetase